MALTKLPKNAIGTGAVKANNIADGTIQNTDISGCASVSADKLSSTLDLSTKSVTFANNEISNAELANSSFTLNGTSVSLGGSQSIITYLDWQAVQVADGSTQVNAEVNKGYFLDTNAGVIEVFLPTSPTRGDVVGLVDYSGTFGTNQLIINTGGVNIDSTVGSEFKVTTNNAIVECVYVDSAKGWLIYLNQAAGTTPSAISTAYGYDVQNTFITATGGTITTSTDYKIHTFTGDGCFVVSAGAGPRAIVDYLVIGGGAGGAVGGGGGGAGGYREAKTGTNGCYTASPLANPTGLQLTATTYPITVGGGGAGTSCANRAKSYPGSNSVFSTITSAGGGGAGYNSAPICANSGIPGGSGGASAKSSGNLGVKGLGNQPPVSPPQGNDGGQVANPAPAYANSGGGGAGAVGSANSGINGGPGGAGVTTSINGTPTTRAGGGGGGGGYPGGASGGSGGPGGGGSGGSPGSGGGSGTANTGSGAGGGGVCGACGAGGTGGKGIVIIRYKFQ